jgi:membrane associated rhomboid family serine protease
MFDLNQLLLFVAVATPLAVLAKTLRRGAHLRPWRLAAVAVLIVAALAWFFFRDRAGYIAGGAWVVLLFVPAIAMRRVADLIRRKRFRSARYLASGIRVLHPSEELRHEIELLRMYESRPDLAPPLAEPAQDRQRTLLNAPAVLVIALLNIAVFLFEILHKNWQHPLNLHRLGALEPYAVIHGHQYWRLFSALFLHFDYLHLTFNVFALYVLGPALERAIGSVRFVACYLIAGLGSSIGVVMLAQMNLVHAEQLVGASGSVMGIVGAWAAFSLRNHHLPLARQRLMNVLLIVAIQTAFDLTTPQISMSAHLCGLAAGFLIGLALSPKKMSI